MSTETIRKKFYGWRMIAGANLVDFFSAGLAFYAYAVFFGFIQEEFSASRFLVSLTVSMTILAAGIYSPLLGYILDKFPIKKVLTIGALIFGFGFILLSITQTFFQFLIVYGSVIALGMVIFGNLSTSKLIANWFNEKIGTALGYASIGLSFSGVIIPPIAVFLISNFTWRGAYLIFGSFVLIVCSFSVYKFFIDKPEDVGQFPDGIENNAIDAKSSITDILSFREILSKNIFWILTIIFTLQLTANLGVYTHIPIFSQDLGYSPLQASWIYSVAAFHAALGKIVFGKLLDNYGARRTIFISLSLHGLGIAILIFTTNLTLLLLAVIVMGLGLGGTIPLMNSTFAIAFGNTNFGKARGLVGPFMVPMQITAAPLSGWLYDTYGNYTLAFSINVVLCIIAGIIVLFLNLPDRK
tara:strand:+ start:1441 stop:2676 length:1236 start_codon:yes stop_codon:yes gene_type:complete